MRNKLRILLRGGGYAGNILCVIELLKSDVVHSFFSRRSDFQNEQIFVAVVFEHIVINFGQNSTEKKCLVLVCTICSVDLLLDHDQFDKNTLVTVTYPLQFFL